MSDLKLQKSSPGQQIDKWPRKWAVSLTTACLPSGLESRQFRASEENRIGIIVPDWIASLNRQPTTRLTSHLRHGAWRKMRAQLRKLRRDRRPAANTTPPPAAGQSHFRTELNMDSLTSRLQQVYIDLGQLLAKPESFGLGQRAPEPLVSAVTAMRRKLKDAIVELDRSDPDDLSAELSEDTV